MAMKKHSRESTLRQGAESTVQEEEDNGLGSAPSKPPVSTASESRLMVEEESGKVVVIGKKGETTDDPHLETRNDTEAEGDLEEASPQQLAAVPPDSENAATDMRGIEGFQERATSEDEESAEGRERPGAVPDAGAAAYGQQEFLGILASVASTVVPTLVSAIGPKVAKGVLNKLGPTAVKLLKAKKKLPGIVGTVARLFEAAEERSLDMRGESSMQVDQAIIDEAAAVLEVIIGADDRQPIRETTKIPWRRICALRISMSNGAVFRGSGFFIGPRVLATAGHCVYMHNQGGWARRIEVIPGCDGSTRPFGETMATTFRSTNGWIQDRKPECDYGCIVLPANAFSGQSLGSFGFAALSNSDLLAMPVVVAGYPGDKPFAELWGMAMKVKAATALQLIYDIDTVGGQSGCPVYVKKADKRYVVGIHNYGAATGNSATRITSAVFNNLQQWRNLGAEAAAAVPKAKAAAAATVTAAA